MSDLPNAVLLSAIREQVKASGARAEAIPAAIKAFSEGEYTDAHDLESWFELQRDKRPDLWPPSAEAKAAADKAAADKAEKDKVANFIADNGPLIERAFTGTGNPDAVARLINVVGGGEADRIAVTFGKRTATDFTTRGVKPSGTGSNDRMPDPNNPYSRRGWNKTEQARVFKQNPQLAANLAAACGVTIASTKPNL